MPIPDFEAMMLPILELLDDGKEHTLNDVLEYIYKKFDVTDKEKKEPLPSGTDLLVRNRARWARLYLERAGLVESQKRGLYKITERGLKIIEKKPTRINNKYLMQFPEFQKFKTLGTEKKTPIIQRKITTESVNPVEILEDAYQRIKAEVAEDLLREIKKASPHFFENVVVELLVKMGYGGSRKDAGQAIGQSGDQGVDGIIKEDMLGLDTIYIQAKRWGGTVGSPQIQGFVGALKGKGANKGIFITTSSFSNEAVSYASKIDSPKIVLIDGQKLADLMIEHNVGVSEITSYSIKKLDSDYFAET